LSSSSKIRFHMGCGEPLQSRWWVARMARNQITTAQGAKETLVRSDSCISARGGKSKS
jgi:hypothetical protein